MPHAVGDSARGEQKDALFVLLLARGLAVNTRLVDIYVVCLALPFGLGSGCGGIGFLSTENRAHAGSGMGGKRVAEGRAPNGRRRKGRISDSGLFTVYRLPRPLPVSGRVPRNGAREGALVLVVQNDNASLIAPSTRNHVELEFHDAATSSCPFFLVLAMHVFPLHALRSKHVRRPLSVTRIERLWLALPRSAAEPSHAKRLFDSC
jgi:hypothetical protein